MSQGQGQVGYTDTPFIPGSSYRVHDDARPQPQVVTPGDVNAEGAFLTAPSDAAVLFDGTDLREWQDEEGNKAQWKVADGYMEVVPRSGSIVTRRQFGDCQVHIEWASPADVNGESQGRGNSGVFLMGRYEIQVLDSYQNPTYADGAAAAIYGQCPPCVNACRPPGEWQSYDIVWVAPRFEGDALASPARVTVLHNGVVVHHNQELLGTTRHKAIPDYEPHGKTGPIKLQDHRDPVRYRNIWCRPL